MTSHPATLKPAFFTKISILSSPSARFANAFTDVEEDRSRGHTSMQSDLRFVDDRINSLALSPFGDNADGENELSAVQACEMAGCFKVQANIRARHYYCSAAEVVGRICGSDEKLRV